MNAILSPYRERSTARAARRYGWLCRAALTALAVALLAAQAQGGEDPKAASRPPDVGRITAPQGERVNLFDAQGNRIGYGIQRSDGSIDLFNADGTRRGTIRKDPGGGGQATTPGKR